jgi:hypothetical protein
MSSFLGSALHVNQALTQYAIAWKPPATREGWFARGDFFGNVPVSKASDIVRTVSQGRMLQLYDAAISADGKPGSGLVQFGIGPNVSFQCKPYVLEGAINDYQRQQADDALQYEKNQMAAPRWALEMALEKLAMVTLLNTSNYGSNVTTLAANEYWDNYASSASSIYDQIATALEKIVLDTGMKVNTGGFSFPVWRVIKGHPGLLRRPFFNQAGTSGYRMTLKDFEALFDEWLEPGSMKVYRGWYNDVAAPNDDDKNGKLFFGPGAIFSYTQKSPDLEDLSFAKQFVFNGLDGTDPMVVMEMQDNTILPMGGTRIRLMASADYKVMHEESGWIFPTVVDTSSADYNNQAGNSWFA